MTPGNIIVTQSQGFRRYQPVRDTLIHELAHNVHSAHDNLFKTLNSQLQKECLQHSGSGELFEYPGPQSDCCLQGTSADWQVPRMDSIQQLLVPPTCNILVFACNVLVSRSTIGNGTWLLSSTLAAHHKSLSAMAARRSKTGWLHLCKPCCKDHRSDSPSAGTQAGWRNG